MEEIKKKKCKAVGCDREFTPYKTTDKYCSPACHYKMQPPEKPKQKRPRIKRKPIAPMSEKRKADTAKYMKIRADFLNLPENKRCPIFGIPTTEIHHKKGRVGYADDWARERGISLLTDKRFFLAVSRRGHRWIEENPAAALEAFYSVLRTN